MASIHKAKEKISMRAKRLSARLTSGLSSPSPPLAELASPLPSSFVTGDGSDLSVPEALQKGLEMLKISNRSQKRVVFRLDPDQGQILYGSGKSGERSIF
jgi:phosphatidylinositol phospholipase C delta